MLQRLPGLHPQYVVKHHNVSAKGRGVEALPNTRRGQSWVHLVQGEVGVRAAQIRPSVGILASFYGFYRAGTEGQ